MQTGAIRCPCCGQECPDLPRLDDLVVALRLTGNLKRLFTVLGAARGRYLSRRELGEILWGDRADGGPEWQHATLRLCVRRLNGLLAKYPVMVDGLHGKGGGHRLVRRWTVENAYSGGYMLAVEERAAA